MYPCADGATPLPGICGWRHIPRPANFVDVAQEAIETGLSSTLPPAVRHHRPPPKLLPKASNGFRHLQKPSGTSRLSRHRPPKPPAKLSRASRTSRGLRPPGASRGIPKRAVFGLVLSGHSQPGARMPLGGPLEGGRNLQVEAWVLGFKSMYIVYIWLTGVAGGRAAPVYGKSPERLYTSILHRLLPLSYPVRVYRLTCFFSV